MKGSVRKPRSPGGEWSYRLDLGFAADGQRRQKQVGGFRTKKDAQTALNDALAGVQRGTYVAPSRQIVGEFLERWIDGVCSELAITAWTNYHDVIGLYVTPPDRSLGEVGAGVLPNVHVESAGSARGRHRPRFRTRSTTIRTHASCARQGAR